VVDNPVPKVSGENLVPVSVCWSRSRTKGWLIGPVLQVFAQLEQVLFQSLLQEQGAPGIALAFAAVQIIPVNVFKRKQGNDAHTRLGR
jgi:hypothetical protein